MEDKNGWKRLEKHLLARFFRAGISDLHGLRQRGLCEHVSDGMYRIGLHKRFGGWSPGHTYERKERKEGKRTWMLSLSDRQSSAVTASGWFGARTVEWDLPPNMHEMGDLTGLA
jgi:hypothetical protein